MFPEFGETAPCRLKSGEVIWTPVSLDDALRLVADFVTYYNNKRLHSAIGYVAPVDKLNAGNRPPRTVLPAPPPSMREVPPIALKEE